MCGVCEAVTIAAAAAAAAAATASSDAPKKSKRKITVEPEADGGAFEVSLAALEEKAMAVECQTNVGSRDRDVVDDLAHTLFFPLMKVTRGKQGKKCTPATTYAGVGLVGPTSIPESGSLCGAVAFRLQLGRQASGQVLVLQLGSHSVPFLS